MSSVYSTKMNLKSKKLFETAKKYIPGGVNSPVRAFRSVGKEPLFIKKAYGSKIYDEEDNEYIDYVCSWGPLILGHARQEVVDAVCEAAKLGTSFGAPTRLEVELAQLICEAVPSIEMVRMVSSGTEAVMSAIRLARGFTGRDLILKFEGCYHGHSDGLLVKAGSGALTTGISDSAGVPNDYAKNTVIATYNDCEQLEEIFKRYGSKLAAVIVEPIAGNMGVVLPKIEFLSLLRQLTHKYEALLIFDEVITGFRVSYGGAQQLYNITPDLTVLGKIIGGGMPVGAYGGRKDIMSLISPIGPVYQAGTLSGNPVAMSAGIATLNILKRTPSIYKDLELKMFQIEEAFKRNSKKYGIAVSVNRAGSLLSAFFASESAGTMEVVDFKTAVSSDTSMFAKYFEQMLNNGIYIAPSQYEAMFVSHAHSNNDIELTCKAIEKSFIALAERER